MIERNRVDIINKQTAPIRSAGGSGMSEKRFVDPEEVKKNLCETFIGASDFAKEARNAACAAVDSAEIINAEPVVYGEWFSHGDGSYTCLNCRRRMSKAAYGWPRCPNCGARMDKEV